MNLRNLITVDENHLLVWDTDTGEILANRLDDWQDHGNKANQKIPESRTISLSRENGKHRQILKPTDRPYFNVMDIKISPNRSLLAICGSKGITIMRMPRKRGNFYHNGKSVIFCETWKINERFFKCQRRLKINQVEWHPFSTDKMQALCILTNDNHLRLYDVTNNSLADDDDSFTELQDVNLNKSVVLDSSSLSDQDQSLRSTSGYGIYDSDDDLGGDDDVGALSGYISTMDLGECAVAFDFGPPVLSAHQNVHSTQSANTSANLCLTNRDPNFKNLNSPNFSTGQTWNCENEQSTNVKEDCLVPVYLVLGTGEILLVYICLDNPYYSRRVIGPLKMLPQAEDNYGSDACSLIVIDSSPPMLAIGTLTGVIYHCFALIDGENSQESVTGIVLQKAPRATPPIGDQHYRIDLLPRQTLYMYESLELDINLSGSFESLDIYNSDSMCPMRLHKDETCNLRYFCTHPNGVHLITVPVIQAFDEASLLKTNVDSFSEFLICTRPLPSSESPCITSGKQTDVASTVAAPRGFAIAVRVAYIALLTLLNDHEVISRRMRPAPILLFDGKHRRSEGRSLIDDLNEMDDLYSIAKEASHEDFDEQLQRILKREISLPVIKSSSSNEAENKSENYCRKLLQTSLVTLRLEYVKRYETAVKALKKKIELLKHDSACQMDQMESCLEEKEKVFRSLELLSGKVDEACKHQEALLARVDKNLESMLMQQPELSDAEARLKVELHNLHDKVSFYRDQLDTLRDKYEFQQEQLKQQQQAASSPKQTGGQSNVDFMPSPMQLLGIKEMLAKQNNEIAELKRILLSSSIAPNNSPRSPHNFSGKTLSKSPHLHDSTSMNIEPSSLSVPKTVL